MAVNLGTPSAFATDAGIIGLFALTSTKGIIVYYRDAGSGNRVYARTVNVSGTSISSLGSETDISQATIDYWSYAACMTSSVHVLVMWIDNASGERQTAVLTVTGDTITRSSPTSTAESGSNLLEQITTDKALHAYNDGSGSYVRTISTVGGTQSLNSTYNVGVEMSEICVLSVSTSMAFHSGNSTARTISISGDVLTVNVADSSTAEELAEGIDATHCLVGGSGSGAVEHVATVSGGGFSEGADYSWPGDHRQNHGIAAIGTGEDFIIATIDNNDSDRLVISRLHVDGTTVTRPEDSGTNGETGCEDTWVVENKHRVAVFSYQYFLVGYWPTGSDVKVLVAQQTSVTPSTSLTILEADEPFTTWTNRTADFPDNASLKSLKYI